MQSNDTEYSAARKIAVPLIAVQLRRDANTITTSTVAPHELVILGQIFGKENTTKLGQVGTVSLDPDAEQTRLANKYGMEKVVAVFGDDGGERLVELIERVEVTDEPAPEAEKPLTAAQKKAAAKKAAEAEAAAAAAAADADGE